MVDEGYRMRCQYARVVEVYHALVCGGCAAYKSENTFFSVLVRSKDSCLKIRKSRGCEEILASALCKHVAYLNDISLRNLPPSQSMPHL